jgi:biotin-dependent carboxylase-like uncharacterized protein
VIEIMTSGTPNSVQDLGRPGYLGMGVGRSGAMDRVALEVGNALVGNPATSAAIEIALFPFKLRFLTDVRFSVTGGGCSASIDDDPLPPCWTQVAKQQQILHLAPSVEGARAYVAFAGGIDVPIVLGSRSTDVKGSFGGLDGRGLQRGDRLNIHPSAVSGRSGEGAGFGAIPTLLTELANQAERSITTVRVLRAAEQSAFTAEARELFASTEWIVTKDANRTGYRLHGPALMLKRPLELFSHGIVPGTIQVPPSGHPIIQLADANTCGGYPKIATVIEADLWRLAQTRVGGRIRFVEVDRDAAIALLRGHAAQIEDLRRAAELIAGR